MKRNWRIGFVFPFTLGTALGVMSGAVLGAILGRRIASVIVSSYSLVSQRTKKEPRFDLLLQ